jgi:xanthine dehydrogenase accessory factor
VDRQAALALGWLRAGRAAVVVEVVAHAGSVPRETGTRMLVAADAVEGTIGGGHLELQAIENARGLLAGRAAPLEQRLALGPALGQCCGGAVTLRYRSLADSEPARWPAPPPRFRLQLYGAGHVGRAIARLLVGIDCAVQWIDERDDAFPAAGEGPEAAHIERLCVEPVEAEVDRAPPAAFAVVLTHSHERDFAIVEAVLRRGDFGFVGLIGSRTKRQRFVHRLQARGIAAEALDRLVCPLGIPGVVGKEPEVIAIATVAQLLAR